MRKILLAVVCVVAFAVSAQVKPEQNGSKKFVNCAAAGSSAQVLPNGKYFMTVHDIRTTVCFGSVCDGGVGTDFPPDFGLSVQVKGTVDGGMPVACLSADGGGDVYFLRDALQ